MGTCCMVLLGWVGLPGARVPGLHLASQRSRAAVGAATEAERVTGRRQLAGLARATLCDQSRPEGPGRPLQRRAAGALPPMWGPPARPRPPPTLARTRGRSVM